jgi:hypothetical protein
MKTIYLVHGWSGSPENCWFPWLKAELEKKGFQVKVPAMPNPDSPELKSWVSYLAGVVGEADENTYFVGHSIGCQAIMRYAQTLDKPVGGAVFVAGFFRLLHLATEEEKIIVKPWLETPIDLEKIKKNIPKLTAIFSDNDTDVDLGDKELFEKNLGARTLVEHNKGHFSDDAGVTELPSALEAIVEMTGN